MGCDQRVATVHSASSSDGDEDEDPSSNKHLPFVDAFMERKHLKHVSSLQLAGCSYSNFGVGVYIVKTLFIPTDSSILFV